MSSRSAPTNSNVSGSNGKSGQSVDGNVSGVASIASKFSRSDNTSKEDGIKLSDKVSDLAGRFGTTVDKDPAKALAARNAIPPGGKYRAAAAAVKNSRVAEEEARVLTEASGKVEDVAKRFAQPSGANVKKSNEDDSMPAFASAADRFRRAEQADVRPEESRVSAFAKRIESGTSGSFDTGGGTERKVAGVARTFESKTTSASSQLDRAPLPTTKSVSLTAAKSTRTKPETSTGEVKAKPKAKPIREQKQGDEHYGESSRIEEDGESLESRFANATKLFQSGRANPERETNTNLSNSEGGDPEDQASSSQSRFADAAKVFGGA